MNGIYPNYVGPTLQARRDSLYPDWLNVSVDVVEPPVVEPPNVGGGIRFNEPVFWPDEPIKKKRKKDEVLLLMH